MAVLLAEVERVKRREPDFNRLREMAEAGARRTGYMNGEEPAWRRIGLAIGYSEAFLHGVLVKHSRPQRDALIALADFFGDTREEWLEAGGYDISSLPYGRGWTTAERDLEAITRWYGSLPPERRERALKEAQDLRDRYEAGEFGPDDHSAE